MDINIEMIRDIVEKQELLEREIKRIIDIRNNYNFNQEKTGDRNSWSINDIGIYKNNLYIHLEWNSYWNYGGHDTNYEYFDVSLIGLKEDALKAIFEQKEKDWIETDKINKEKERQLKIDSAKKEIERLKKIIE